MLKHTFCHLPGVSLVGERALWDRGVATWEAYQTQAGARSERLVRLSGLIEGGRREMEQGNAAGKRRLFCSPARRCPALEVVSRVQTSGGLY